MFEDKDSRLNPIFMKRRLSWPFSNPDVECCEPCDASYTLPCFAVVKDKAGGKEKECSMLWVAERARNYGFGSRMVAECKVTHALCVLPESSAFWTKLGFEADHERGYEKTYVRNNMPRKKRKH